MATICIPRVMLDEARGLGLNVSECFRQGLYDAIEKARQEARLAEFDSQLQGLK